MSLNHHGSKLTIHDIRCMPWVVQQIRLSLTLSIFFHFLKLFINIYGSLCNLYILQRYSEMIATEVPGYTCCTECFLRGGAEKCQMGMEVTVSSTFFPLPSQCGGCLSLVLLLCFSLIKTLKFRYLRSSISKLLKPLCIRITWKACLDEDFKVLDP